MDEKSITENRYEIPSLAGDEKSSEILKKILDLESSANSIPDWHSTHTFQVFLDSLDIGHKTVSTKSHVEINSDGLDNHSEKAIKDDSQNNTADHQSPSNPPKPSGPETILSAEALKILSELPELSHMTSTRSFMFPKSPHHDSASSSKR